MTISTGLFVAIILIVFLIGGFFGIGIKCFCDFLKQLEITEEEYEKGIKLDRGEMS